MTRDDIAVSILDVALELINGTGTITVDAEPAKPADVYVAAGYLAAGLADALADAPGTDDTPSSILENLQWQIRINQIASQEAHT